MSIFGNSVEINSSGKWLKIKPDSIDKTPGYVRTYDYKDNQWVKRRRNLFDKFIMWIDGCGG